MDLRHSPAVAVDFWRRGGEKECLVDLVMGGRAIFIRWVDGNAPGGEERKWLARVSVRGLIISNFGEGLMTIRLLFSDVTYGKLIGLLWSDGGHVVGGKRMGWTKEVVTTGNASLGGLDGRASSLVAQKRQFSWGLA